MKTKLLLLIPGLFMLLSGVAGQSIDFGKSYINVTKGLNGGTVEPGDTLEIRASIVVRSGSYDSCGYRDNIPSGTSYIPGTVRVLTNEGKIYKQFTDVSGDDQGWITGGAVGINLGFNGGAAPGNAFRRGRIVNTHKPSFYGGTCIMIASFRVKVTAAYNSFISIGGGFMSYTVSGAVNNFVFPGRTIAVYQNYGMCPNAVGSNALGTEFNGTFGSGKPRNRGTSANVPPGYTYDIFTSGGPNDYYYGISNNTSINTGYTTSNSWPKPDNTHRVFGVWDIIGDHTGATNASLGNPATDTVAKSNGGYMLVINAAYRIDSAFQQTISNLCPNSYYEISIWMRNICSRCGCDSAGRGVSSAGYIPTAAGDSSGVYPNLSFNVNGIDYYSTGNIQYTGNWIRKGFVIQTGASQTSFTLKIFNNAPGGGGNDWALDDIAVATCSPNLQFTPNNNPTVCKGNVVDIGAWVRSYFNNYIYYRWQKSTDNGLTWVNDGGISTGSPSWNGSSYEYYTSYPTFVANASDSGMKFRVVVASTSGNISNASCSFADVTSVLTLNVIDCGAPLSSDIISFNAVTENDHAKLNWTISHEEAGTKFFIEKSFDGINFTSISFVNVKGGVPNQSDYQWTDSSQLNQSCYYRIRMSTSNQAKFSNMRLLRRLPSQTLSVAAVNPFDRSINLDVECINQLPADILVTDVNGKQIIKRSVKLTPGTNHLNLDCPDNLPGGYYTLRVIMANEMKNLKLIKL